MYGENCDSCGASFPVAIFALYEDAGKEGCPACNPPDELGVIGGQRVRGR